MISKLIELAEKGIIPDYFIRQGIVRNCENRLSNENVSNTEKVSSKKQIWIEQMKESPIALVPEKANEQHYEVPPAFFENVLGKHLKYSSGYWPDGVNSLDQSEESMLELSFERAQLADGDSILELGCGWGSLTCYMASKLPNSKITAVSNSKDQKEHILNRCKNQGLDNIEVITADMNDFGTEINMTELFPLKCLNTCAIIKNYYQKFPHGYMTMVSCSYTFLPINQLFIHLRIKEKQIGWQENFFQGG